MIFQLGLGMSFCLKFGSSGVPGWRHEGRKGRARWTALWTLCWTVVVKIVKEFEVEGSCCVIYHNLGFSTFWSSLKAHDFSIKD